MPARAAGDVEALDCAASCGLAAGFFAGTRGPEEALRQFALSDIAAVVVKRESRPPPGEQHVRPGHPWRPADDPQEPQWRIRLEFAEPGEPRGARVHPLPLDELRMHVRVGLA